MGTWRRSSAAAPLPRAAEAPDLQRPGHAQRHADHAVGPLLDHPPRAGRDPRRPHQRRPLERAAALRPSARHLQPAQRAHPARPISRRGVGYCYNGFDTWDYEYYYIGSVGQKFKQINYAVNPWSGLQVQSLDVAYIPDDGPPDFSQQNGNGYYPRASCRPTSSRTTIRTPAPTTIATTSRPGRTRSAGSGCG